MQHLHDRAVGIGEIRRGEKTGCTEKNVVPVTVEAQGRFPPLCAGHVGCAEQQRPQGSFHLRGHFRPRTCRTNGLLRTSDVHGLKEIRRTRTGNCFQIGGEAFPADGCLGAFE